MAKRHLTKNPSTVSFHDEPVESEKKEKYKKILERAKGKSKNKPGPLEGTPRFDQMPSTDTRPEFTPGQNPERISETTEAGLQAMQRATSAKAEKEAKESSSDADFKFVKNELTDGNKEEKKESEEDKMRRVIESRLSDVDIGLYLMSGGELLQEVPIIPGKLVVEFRTATDYEEFYVDNQLSKERDMTNRQFFRRANEWALATHINSLNGTRWPKVLDPSGGINEEALEHRLGLVRQLPSQLFSMLMQNLAWFLDRVSTSLTMEALGNG